MVLSEWLLPLVQFSVTSVRQKLSINFVHFESLGGALQLTRWVDFDAMNEEDVTIERGDPAWIGAWWVGIISCFGFAFITSIPFFGFPKSIPGTAKEALKTAVHV